MSDTTESHSDVGESTTDSWSSSEWSMVDSTGHLQDEESGSTTSSVEVVEEEDDSSDQRTPLSGNSPTSQSTPLFVLRLASRVPEDADDDPSEDVESITDSQLFGLDTLDTSISDTTVVQTGCVSSPPPALLVGGEKQTTKQTVEEHITDSQSLSQDDMEERCTRNAQHDTTPNTGLQSQEVPRDQIESLVQVIDNLQVSLIQSLSGPSSQPSGHLAGNETIGKEKSFEEIDATTPDTEMQNSSLFPQEQSPVVSSSDGTNPPVPDTPEVQQACDAVDGQDLNQEEQEAVSRQCFKLHTPWFLAVFVAVVAIVTATYFGPMLFTTKSKIEATQEGFCIENLRSCRKDLDAVRQEILELRKHTDQQEPKGDFNEKIPNEKMYTQAEFDEALEVSMKQKETDFSKVEFEKVLDYIWLKIQEKGAAQQSADGEGKSEDWVEDNQPGYLDKEEGSLWKGFDRWWDVQTKMMEEYKNLKEYLPEDLLAFLSKFTQNRQSEAFDDDVAETGEARLSAGGKISDNGGDSSHAGKKQYKARGSQTNSEGDSGQSGEAGFEPGIWADTVLDMVNSTKGQIEDIWLKVKNMSDNLLKKHEPSLKRIQNKFVKKVHQLSEKFQTKLAKKVKKWFGTKKDDDNIRQQGTLKRQGVKTKRRDYVVKNGEGFLSEGGRCRDSGGECYDSHKKEAEEDKYVEPDMVHGGPDDSPLGGDDSTEEEPDDDDYDKDDDYDENWYIARAKDRDYYHTEPEDWYFQRFKEDTKPMLDKKVAKTDEIGEAVDDNWYMGRAEDREYHHNLPDDWYFRRDQDENYHLDKDEEETDYPRVNKEHSKYRQYKKHGQNRKEKKRESYHA